VALYIDIDNYYKYFYIRIFKEVKDYILRYKGALAAPGLKRLKPTKRTLKNT
jgi:hypothetical protein